ncbi:peroxiredoxin [Sinomonas albida]|uniref:peroxiredoxin n=1 Tax=Sinomonas albida TaxID=369942 RepID=UPI001F3E315F|nr:peroxiredoxin [Sinomonas albida]
MYLPSLKLPTSDGGTVSISELGVGRTVIYLYPLTGQPGANLPEGWDAIPGARGCSTEACSFRDHFEDLRRAGVDSVFGLSSQDPDYQAEVVKRPHLPFVMLSDERLQLAASLKLPTFSSPRPPSPLLATHPRGPRRADRAGLLPCLPAEHPRSGGGGLAQGRRGPAILQPESLRVRTWLRRLTAHELGIHLQDAGAPPKEGIMLPRTKNRDAPSAAGWVSTIHQPVQGQCSPVWAKRSSRAREAARANGSRRFIEELPVGRAMGRGAAILRLGPVQLRQAQDIWPLSLL